MPVCESRAITNNRKMRDRSAGVDMQTGIKGVMFDLESIFFFVVRLQV